MTAAPEGRASDSPESPTTPTVGSQSPELDPGQDGDGHEQLGGEQEVDGDAEDG